MLNKTRDRVVNVLTNEYIGRDVNVWGWIRTSRFSKNFGFIEINDGSCFNTLQLIIDLKQVKIEKNQLLTGACISINGKVVESQGSKQNVEVQVNNINVVGEVDENYPLQKKKHSLEFLRDFPHLRSRTNTFLAVFNIRNKISYAIHEFFQEKNFLYIHSPFFTKNDCEGGGEAFQVTTLDFEKIAKSGEVDFKDDFFKQKVFLTVSGQLEAEPFALSHGEVYTFGPTFRADPSDTPRHAAEFWMVEPEMAFYDFEDLIELIEEFIKKITEKVSINCREEINFLSKATDQDIDKRINVILNNKFEIITYTEVIEILKENRDKFENDPQWGVDLFSEHEKFIAAYFNKPVFVTHYPESFKPFYMWLDENEKTVSCLDLLLPDIGEIITGSKREHRYDLLEKRIQQKGMEVPIYEWYLQTRKWGSAPHAGFGLGFERMVMYLTGIKNIKDVLPFPRAARKLY